MPHGSNAHIIVVGNEKGGTGKSTISMHLIVALLQEGFRVGSVDLDGRQATLTRYIENRESFIARSGVKLPLPEHIDVTPAEYSDPLSSERDEKAVALVIQQLAQTNDVVVVDMPGADSFLFRIGHRFANTLITPMNDSLVDLDVLARVDSDTLKITGPSHYAERVWSTRQEQAKNGLKPMEWIVLRNRLFHLKSHNKVRMQKLIKELGKRIGFTPLRGLGERVIYREMFLKGLTILDMRNEGLDMRLSASHIAARNELRTLVRAIDLANLVQKAS